jgi:hypothetical protein
VPELADGITRLAGGGVLGVALRAIAVGELSREDAHPDAPAYWVDVGGAAATRGLYDRGLDPATGPTLRIARAFTAYQHFSLVERLCERLSEATPFVVCSNVARLYDDDDVRRGEARELLGAAMERLAEAVEAHDVPTVLTTGSPGDRRLAAIVDVIADRTTRCRPTRLGLRFSGEDFETETYGSAWGDHQTTFEYWASVAVARSSAARWADDRVEEWVERPLEPVGPSYPTVG